jgi:hypothetical protein
MRAQQTFHGVSQVLRLQIGELALLSADFHIVKFVGRAVKRAGGHGAGVGREGGTELAVSAEFHREIAGGDGLTCGRGEGRPDDDHVALRGRAVGAVDGIGDLTQCQTCVGQAVMRQNNGAGDRYEDRKKPPCEAARVWHDGCLSLSHNVGRSRNGRPCRDGGGLFASHPGLRPCD